MGAFKEAFMADLMSIKQNTIAELVRHHREFGGESGDATPERDVETGEWVWDVTGEPVQMRDFPFFWELVNPPIAGEEF